MEGRYKEVRYCFRECIPQKRIDSGAALPGGSMKASGRLYTGKFVPKTRL